MLLKVYDKIRSLKLPSHWEERGVSPPNEISMKKAYECCCYVFRNYRLKPYCIMPTIVDGIYMKYKNMNKALIFEIDNDEDIGILANDDVKKEILCNEDIKNIEELTKSKCLEIFMR